MANAEAVSNIAHTLLDIHRAARKGSGVASYDPKTEAEQEGVRGTVEGWGYKEEYSHEGGAPVDELFSDGLAAITDKKGSHVTIYGPTGKQLDKHAKDVLHNVKRNLPP